MKTYDAIMENVMHREIDRLNFITKERGVDEMIRFAKQGVEQYTRALQTPYGKVYKEELTGSISVFKQHIKFFET